MADASPKLLVVDDEAINLEIISEHLAGEDYEIVTALEGREALQLLDHDPDRFDALLLDHMMPGLDGLSLLALLKGDERFKLLPVIMQTAAAAPNQIARGLELGAYYYLTKPYEGRALRSVVRTAVRGRAETRELAMRVKTYAGAMPLLVSGRFRFRSLADARDLAPALASVCPNTDIVAMGLTELFVNAIEHGNLQISYAEKSRLAEEQRWEEEVGRRLALPENADKWAEVWFERSAEAIRFTVKDQGSGFDCTPYLELTPDRAFDLHGRGIALARQLSFTALEYLGAGNEVVATVGLDRR